MAHSGSRSGQRTEVAPPRDPSSRVKRTGYVLLAASGVVLATAFGAIAELATPSSAGSGDVRAGNSNSLSGPETIPGNAVPGETMTVTGVALPDGTTATSTTAVVSVGPDGKQTVTLLPPPGSSKAPIVLPPGSPIPSGATITTTTVPTTTGPASTSTSTSTSMSTNTTTSTDSTAPPTTTTTTTDSTTSPST